MDAKSMAAAQLAGLTGAAANLGKHRRGDGGGAAPRRLSQALAKATKEGLMRYYMEKKGYTDPEELYDDPLYSDGVFGRVQWWDGSNVIELFRASLGCDLEANVLFCKVQEFFLGQEDGAKRNTDPQEGELFAYLPARPVEDHITNCIEFFVQLP